MKKNQSDSVNKLHFIYVIIMGSLFILFLLATILLDYTKTITTLSNSGVLLSIVLAIVAILITLWDVAGQKNALYEVKEQVNTLRDLTEEIKSSAETSKSLVTELKDFDSRFGVDFEPIREKLDAISERITLDNTENSEIIAIKKSFEELKTLVIEKEKSLDQMKHSINNDFITLSETQVFLYLIQFVNSLKTGEEFTKVDAYNYLKKKKGNKKLRLSDFEEKFYNVVEGENIDRTNAHRGIYLKL